jgi:hypothetical protein
VLTSRPTADVTVGLSSNYTAEGPSARRDDDYEPNWNTPQTVTVTGVTIPRSAGQVVHILTAAATRTGPQCVGFNGAGAA